jgi:hypothetical protein
MLIVSFHLMNALANACARWSSAWLRGSDASTGAKLDTARAG